MGEYLKYKNEKIKIGTLYNLYYATYNKFIDALNAQYLKGLYGNKPAEYIKPDTGFFFRFPFPDEDKFPLGDIGKHDFLRSLPVDVNFNEIAKLHNNAPVPEAENIRLDIIQQTLVHREEDRKLILALIVSEPKSGKHYRIESDKDIENLITQMYRNHVMNEPDKVKSELYRISLLRILEGYIGEIPVLNAAAEQKKEQQKSIRKGRGIK